MKIHGDKILKRRKQTRIVSNHRDYYDDLKIDFHSLCGYCGKNSDVFFQNFQVDHFVPQHFDPDLKLEYTNLVFSCPRCNRGKSNHWPTENKTISHNSIEGFVDPTLEEYNNHLKRDPKGNIVALTPVGEYMHSKFKFNVRPISIIWKAMQLKEKIDTLNKIIESTPDTQKQLHYIQFVRKLETFRKDLFEKGEIL